VSDKNMDDLLAELKGEFEPQPPKTNAQKPQARKPQQPPQKSTNAASMEQMLAELRTDLESGRNRPGHPSQQSATPINNQDNAKHNRQRLNALIDADYQQQAQKREAKLAEIKRQEEAKIAEQKRRQQELIEAQRREETTRAQT
jgi:hypothetical protein